MADTPTDADTTPEVAPLDVDGVGAVAFGTIAWTVALVLCLVFRGPLAEAGNGWWTWVCLAGALLLLSCFVPLTWRTAVILILIFTAALLPLGYSWLLFRKKEKEK